MAATAFDPDAFLQSTAPQVPPVAPATAAPAPPANASANGFDPDQFLSAVGLGTPGATPKYPAPTGNLASPISTGLAQGIANVAALPGTAIALAGSPMAQQALPGLNIGYNLISGLAKKAASVVTGSPVPDNPTDTLQGLGQQLAAAPAQIMRDPAVNMLPQDPNWRPPTVGGRFVQNLASYIPATLTMQPELLAGKGIMGALASNVGAATAQTGAEEVAPGNGTASTIAALVGGLAPAAATRLPAFAAGIGANLAGDRAPQVAAGLNAYKDAVYQGGGPIASRTAFAPAYEQEGVNQVLKKSAELDPRAGTDPAVFGPQANPAQQAGLNILAAADQVPTANGFAPLTAGVTDNSGVKAYLNAIGKQNPAVIQATTENNQAAVSRGLADATTPAGVTPENPAGTSPTAASDFFANRFGGRRAADQIIVDTTDQAAQDAAAAPISGQSDIEAAQGSAPQAEAAGQVRSALEQREAQSEADYKNAYDQVRQGSGDLPIPQTNVGNAIADMRARQGPNEDIPPLIVRIEKNGSGSTGPVPTASDPSLQPYLDRIYRNSGSTGGGTFSPAPLSHVQSNLILLKQARSQAIKDGRNFDAANFGKLIDANRADLEAAADQSGNQALKAANSKFKAHQETFVDNEAGAALDRDTAPENTVSKFLRTGSPERGSRQLAVAIGDNPAAASGVKTDFLGQLGSAKYGGGNPTSAHLDQFLTDHGSALESFPEIRQAITNMRDSAAAKEATLARATATSESAKQGAAATVAEQAAHPAAPFVEGAQSGYLNGQTPEQAIASVYRGEGSSSAKMRALVALAKKDSTGQALEGLKNANSRYLNTKYRNASQVGGDLGEAYPLASNRNPSQAKLGSALEIDGETRDALGQLYTPEEMQKFDMVHKQNRVTINSTAKNTGANSTTNQETEANKSIIKMLGESGGKTGILAKVLKKAFPGGDFEEARKAAHVAILTDPRAAAAGLLKPNSPQSISRISDLLKSAVPQLPSKLAPAISTGAEQEQKAGEKANPTSPTAPQNRAIAPKQTSASAEPQEEVRRAIPVEQEEVRKALPVDAPFDAASHVMKNEGVTTTQDGRKEYFGFRAGEGTGYNEIRKLVLQKGADSPEVKNLVSNLLAARASRAGVDQFSDPGTQAALTTMAHMRGEAGSRAIMAAVGGQPLYKSLGTIPQKAVDAINQMNPADFQNKLQAARENYDRQFYWNTPSSVTTNGRTRTGTFGNLYGKGLLDRYSRERNDFLALSNQQT